MQKSYFFIITLFCFSFSACSQPSLEDRRIETMTEIIEALIKNDTIKIDKLVDTAFAIKMNGRDGFMHSIKVMHNEISKKAGKTSYEFASKPGIANTIDYTIRFYLQNSKYNYMELTFSFNPGWYNQVYSLDAILGRIDYINEKLTAPPKN